MDMLNWRGFRVSEDSIRKTICLRQIYVMLSLFFISFMKINAFLNIRQHVVGNMEKEKPCKA